MDRWGQVGFLVAVVCAVIASESGCGGGNAVNATGYAVPATITMAPAGSVSMELGTDQQFTATPEDPNKSPIAEPVFYQSSNSAVVSVAVNGLVCAGTWDSLSVPQICSPGPVGFADVTAVTQGVSSPSTRVYVHQHIDSVTITPVPPGPATTCLTASANAIVAHAAAYQATAYGRGVDITATAGQFNWQVLNTGVADISTTARGLVNVVNGQSLNQVMVTAKAPGVTPLFATVGNTSSVPFSFTTCPVQSIQLAVTASSATSKTITPTVVDTLGTTLTGVPLTWSYSQSSSVSVNGGLALAATGGGSATIIASCSPPTCNIGFQPSVPIYPENVVTLVPQTVTTPTETVYVSSTGCGTIDTCVSTIVPVTNPQTKVGDSIILPGTPNSLLFDQAGAKAYLGTNSSLLGSKGLSVLSVSGNTVTGFNSTPGKVLAVSPDGSKVVVSDTADSPNQVFVFDTSGNIPTAYRITGATAADFSPDSLKAFIVAGSTLYVYSKADSLQTKALTAPANDVSFLAEGAFAYLAGGNPSGVTVQRTCDNSQADTVDVSPVPTFLKTLPDATGVVALIPPDVGVIHVAASPSGCTPSVSDSLTTFDLGRGTFAASQLIISQDGSTAYIVTPDFNSILVFNIAAQTSSAIPLVGNGFPLGASLTPDGTQLYVGSSDGTLHVLQTDVGADVQQITFPQSLCQTTAGQPFPGVTCNPDLVAAKP
ncbi:MAG: hypothetical protein WAL32_15620 [Terriglobales bacterium]